MDKLVGLLSIPTESQSTQTLKVTLWALSNLVDTKTTAGVDFPKVFSKNNEASERVVNLAFSYSREVRMEAIWVLCNAITCNNSVNSQQVRTVLIESTKGMVIQALANSLRENDLDLVVQAMSALNLLICQ